ncbi:unnamed protein product [Arctogadus glacialis]
MEADLLCAPPVVQLSDVVFTAPHQRAGDLNLELRTQGPTQTRNRDQALRGWRSSEGGGTQRVEVLRGWRSSESGGPQGGGPQRVEVLRMEVLRVEVLRVEVLRG